MSMTAVGLLAALLYLPSARPQAPQPDGGGIRPGSLPAAWNTGGPKCMEMPEWQLQEYNPDLYFLRQSACTDYKKPFVFLFFGPDPPLLLAPAPPPAQSRPTNTLIRPARLRAITP